MKYSLTVHYFVVIMSVFPYCGYIYYIYIHIQIQLFNLIEHEI